MPLSFKWDTQRALSNAWKHSVKFTEAAQVFSDPFARIFADEEHSDVEQREIIVGYSRAGQL